MPISRTGPNASLLKRSCLLITLYYIDQMCGRMPRFTISSLTVHRFLIASVCVSTKALCDAFCTNSHYAKIGGIKLAELNVLEREFLLAMDWRLIVSHVTSHYFNLSNAYLTSNLTPALLTADPVHSRIASRILCKPRTFALSRRFRSPS